MITQVTLKNFKCHIDAPFEMGDITLFAGNNGMGKSSVIQSLLLLKQSFASTKLQNQGKVDLANFSYVDLETAEKLCYAKAYPKTVSIELESDKSGLHTWSIDASMPKESVLKVHYTGENNLLTEALFKESCIYLGAERIGPRRTYSRKSGRVFNTILGVQGELTPSYILQAINRNDLIGIEGLKHPKASSLEFYENLNAWASDILGRSITARVDEENDEEVNLSYSVKGAQGGKFSALQVGFGYSFSLPIIVSALIARKDDLLIIENPEAHLHPSAQTKIAKMLALVAQYSAQVIIETHSDHVLNAIRVMVKGDQDYGTLDAEKIRVHFFYNDNNETEEVQGSRLLKVYSDGRLDGWPTGLFDEWEKNLTALLR